MRQLNFVEWLACLLRLALISFGAAGVSPENAVTSLADSLLLSRPQELQRHLDRVSRSGGGFGSWVDGTVPAQDLSHVPNKLRRPLPLEDYMRPHAAMVELQVLTSFVAPRRIAIPIAAQRHPSDSESSGHISGPIRLDVPLK